MVRRIWSFTNSMSSWLGASSGAASVAGFLRNRAYMTFSSAGKPGGTACSPYSPLHMNLFLYRSTKKGEHSSHALHGKSTSCAHFVNSAVSHKKIPWLRMVHLSTLDRVLSECRWGIFAFFSIYRVGVHSCVRRGGNGSVRVRFQKRHNYSLCTLSNNKGKIC